ncbi:hypothetical protein ACFR9U_09865 [Halorientalis brevis]|uniref:DUF7308 domain-containing protein n=1 Tax=Halorientalis brevis TaxID=1126241 RepID=A0ABD6CA96_9EURY|nr:hypothetical protein [Halorientalis brevis]
MSPGGVRQRLSGDARGQSSPLGYLLVIAVVLAGTIAVVSLGTTAMESTRGQSELQRAEHSMTLFDSRTAMVALGASNTQTISFGQDSGSFTTEPDAGWIALKHHNYSENDNVEVLYNESLGKLLYTNGKTEIAYQGGGVWRKDDVGDAMMVSPPEFHYRRATLTLPIIRVRSDSEGSSTSRVSVSRTSPEQSVYPNATSATVDAVGAPYNHTSGPKQYENPIENGTVYAWVNSEYYEGWAEYFRQRTTGNVTVYDNNQTVRLELVSFGGAPGQFTLPQAGDSVDAGGISDGHPINEFDVTLDIEQNKPHFSFYATEEGKEFEIHVYSDVNPNNACSDPDEDVYVGVYYHDGDGSTEYESFETAVDPDSVSGMNWQCSGGDLKLHVDFLSSIPMEYDEIGSKGDNDPNIDDPNCGTSTGVTLGNKYAFNEHMQDCDGNGWELRDTATWDEHEDTVSDEPAEYDEGAGDTESMNAVVNHYLQLTGPDVDLIAKTGPGNSDPINEPASRGALNYDETKGSEFIAFLHVTENDVQVEFN